MNNMHALFNLILKKQTPKKIMSYAIISATLIYLIAYTDPYVVLFILPFFVFGSGRKRPLTIVFARACVPVLVLFMISTIKFKITGVPLVSYDHNFIGENILLLAYNDWRVDICLLIITVAISYYFYGFSFSRSHFSNNEKMTISMLSLISVFCLWNIFTWDHDLFNLNAEQNAPSIRAFIKSTQLPDPRIDTLSDAEEAPVIGDATLRAPAWGSPDLYFILQESTFHPQLLSPNYEPKALYAKTSDKTGPLRVHTYGGGTWKSEFSLTVQMRPQEFGGDGMYVFYQLEGRVKRSIFTILKSLGYRTMVFYPVPGNFLNADKFYKTIGVDEFYDPQTLGISSGWDWKIPDSAFYKAMEKKVAESKQPVVAFMLTINQHGPHEKGNALADYIARFNESDVAYSDFLNHLKRQTRKSGVVAFGDHQPDFTEGIVDTSVMHTTNYDLRCMNFECSKTPMTDRGDKKIDIVLLGTMSLESFGFALDGFSELQKTVFKKCEDDITLCDDISRRTFNSAFSSFFH